ncbi:alpha-tocopherol transfer protein-like isoform X2 [Varroa jacobsoni]|uniref:alpha-tocopherol transfer protein-like isoform X2 n=1 Tax=Varroa jacobsoni TaxID=62625 RepID=UPI000BF321E2|nr:alpha-tocopherol transfer protein-like isoform X2 [Varroa jacobsoni]
MANYLAGGALMPVLHCVLKNYYKIRSNHPHIFGAFHPSAQEGTINLNLQTILRGRDRNGCAVFIFKGGCWDPKTTKPEDIFKVNVMFLEQSIQDPITQVNGISAIMDMKHFGLLQLRHSPPAHLQKVVQLIQDCFPARFKAIHIVHEPAVFGILFGIVKRFLNTKLQKRIHFHGSNYDSLHEHVPASVLPEEYGGELPTMNNQDYSKAMFARDDEYITDLQYGFQKRDAGCVDSIVKDTVKDHIADNVDNKKILSAATTG